MKYLGLKRRRDLRRKKWQYGAVLITVVLGVMMYASSYDSYRNLDGSYNATYERLSFADMEITGGSDDLAGDVRDIDGVAEVATRPQAETAARLNGDNLVLRLVGMPPGEQPDINQVDVVKGDYLDPEDDRIILAETHFATRFELVPGDQLKVFTGAEWIDVTIGGEAVSPEYIWPAQSRQNIFPNPDQWGVVFVSKDLLEHLPPGATTSHTLVVYDKDADVEETDRQVKAAARDAGASDTQTQEKHPSAEALRLDVEGFRIMAIMFPALFLFAAGMAVYMLLTRLVYAERVHIGTLRANGVSRRDVLNHYLRYGLELGLIGAIIGIALGIPMGWGMTGLYTGELGIPDTHRSLYASTVYIGLLFGVVAGLLSAWVPARAAARISPAEAMRGLAPAAPGKRSLLERVVPTFGRGSVLWRMVLRDIGRNKKRSASTLIAVTLALVLILSAWGMIDTVIYLIDRQFTELALEDAVIVGAAPVSDDMLDSIGEIDGVGTVEPVLMLGATVKGPDDSYATQLQAFEADTVMHMFDGFDEVPTGGILAGQAIGDDIGVDEEGTHEVVLSLPSLGASLTVEILGFVDEPVGTYLYAERDWLMDELESASGIEESALQAPTTSVAMVRLEDGVDRTGTLDRVESLDAVAVVSDSRVIYELFQDFMGLFYALVGMMLVFGGIMAFALIFNTMSVNFAERATEIATMRANGFSRARVAGLIVVEDLLLTATAIPIGLVVGHLSAAWFMSAFSSDLLAFDLHMQPTTYVISALVVFAVTALAMLPGIRSVGRIDIAEVVRERSQ